MATEAQLFHYSIHQKWLPYQILVNKTVKNVDPQITEIWLTELIVKLSVSE